MKIMDAHCDALLKQLDPALSFYESNETCHVSYENMVKSDVGIQVFALFVPPEEVPSSHRLDYTLNMIDIFYEKVVKEGLVTPITKAGEIAHYLQKDVADRGAILSLEGADALQGNIVNLRTLYRLGVRALGFTWNYRNEVADGVGEPKPGGLSTFGREVVKEANRLGILLDVSHLAEPGFWDVVELSQKPFIASHSNCKAICGHRRNLTDEQLKAIFQKNGVVGLTFVPDFVSDCDVVTIDDLLRHLDHALSLGGEDHLAFGSDFDGIDTTMSDLQHTGCYPLLIEALLKRYKEKQVKKWMHGNWQRIFSSVLP